MSRRTVVGVEERGDGSLVVKLVKAPVAFPEARVGKDFACSPDQMPPWTQPDAVRAHGQALLEKLMQAHPAVNGALADVLKTPFQQKHALYFHVMTDEAERLYWETLCDAQGNFLALDARWPIARMADSEVDLQPRAHLFSPPLRIMALLSALNIDATPEWKRLYTAVAEAREEGLAIELTVLVGQEDLFDTIKNGIDDGTFKDVDLQPIRNRTAKIDALIEKSSPHILHFFCHGSTGSGSPRLELATFTDWDEGKAHGSVVLAVEGLMGFTGMQDVWLVALNCCEGGKAAGELHSMVHRLVAAGVPTAVGMLEPIDASDAYEFSGMFYPSIFASLRRVLEKTPAGEIAEVPWVEALHLPRTALSESHQDPANHREWALPVLYVRPEAFQLQLIAPAAGGAGGEAAAQVMMREVELVAGALKALPPDTPQHVRQSILAILTAKNIPPSLHPDELGNFTTPGG